MFDCLNHSSQLPQFSVATFDIWKTVNAIFHTKNFDIWGKDEIGVMCTKFLKFVNIE